MTVQAKAAAATDAWSVWDYVAPRNPVTKERELHIIPESVEIAIGSSIYTSMINSQGGEDMQSDFTPIVKEVGKKLSRVCDRPKLPYQFTVLDSNVLNAWCLPGGKIGFNRGLIEKMMREESDFGLGKRFTVEEKIAAVMGHEITHAAARHSAKSLEFAAFLTVVLITIQVALKALIVNLENQKQQETGKQRKKTENLGAVAKAVDAIFNSAYGLIRSLVSNCAGRAKEFEADRYGMLYLKRAGYDPKAAIWLQSFFAKQHPKSDNSGIAFITNLFSTHPHSEDRVAANRQTLKDLKAGKLV